MLGFVADNPGVALVVGLGAEGDASPEPPQVAPMEPRVSAKTRGRFRFTGEIVAYRTASSRGIFRG